MTKAEIFHQYRSCRGMQFAVHWYSYRFPWESTWFNIHAILLELKVNVNENQVGPVLPEDRTSNIYLNPLSKWLLKLHIFLPAQEKNFNKDLSSARVTVERAFEMLNVRWRGLLTTLVTNRENFSNTSFVLHDFCHIDGEEY